MRSALALIAVSMACMCAASFAGAESTLSSETKLKIFVVPHSHCDPGWWKTADDYYASWVSQILRSIVASLAGDKRRKFVWSEISFFRRWWDEASSGDREDVKKLLRGGQLEFVNGGWVQPDEASNSVGALVDNWRSGHEWLNKNVYGGGIMDKDDDSETEDVDEDVVRLRPPRIGWAIDPFGHSRTAAAVAKAAGMDAIVINRIPRQDKESMRKNKELEFWWETTGGSSSDADADAAVDEEPAQGQDEIYRSESSILTHVLAYPLYDIPNTCGPDWDTCATFDFERPVAKKITSQNVQERAQTLLGQYKQKAAHFRHRNLLVPLGDDFKYKGLAITNSMFENYQLLFDHINNDPSYNAEIGFRTLSEYFDAVADDVTTAGGADGKDSPAAAAVALPSYAGDFFTYEDQPNAFWSGYFTTRPALKLLVRRCESLLRAGDSLLSLHGAHTMKRSTVRTMSSLLDVLREEISLFAHHDGITGTSRAHVVEDYSQRMAKAFGKARDDVVLPLLALATNSSNIEEAHIFDVSRPRDGVRERPLVLTGNRQRSVVVSNSLMRPVDELISIVLESPCLANVGVFSGSAPVSAQVSPIWQFEQVEKANQMPVRVAAEKFYRLWFRASVPSSGAASFTVRCTTEKGSTHVSSVKIHASNSDISLQLPRSWFEVHDERAAADTDVTLSGSNGLSVSVDARTGLMTKAASLRVEQRFMRYSGTRGGAYLFMPTKPAEAFTDTKPPDAVMSSSGPLVQEVVSWHIVDNLNAVLPWRRIRVRSPAEHDSAEIDLELEQSVSLNHGTDSNSEIIMRLQSEITNNFATAAGGSVRPHILTDSNSLQLIPRAPETSVDIAGRHFPATTLAVISSDCSLVGACSNAGQDSSTIVAAMSHACAVASLQQGELDFVLDRRLMQDDGRGLGEPVRDNVPHTSSIRLLIFAKLKEPLSVTKATARRWWDHAEVHDGALHLFHSSNSDALSWRPFDKPTSRRANSVNGVHLLTSSAVSDRGPYHAMLAIKAWPTETSSSVRDAVAQVFGSCATAASSVGLISPTLSRRNSRAIVPASPSAAIRTQSWNGQIPAHLRGDKIVSVEVQLSKSCAGYVSGNKPASDSPLTPEMTKISRQRRPLPHRLSIDEKTRDTEDYTLLYAMSALSVLLMLAAILAVVVGSRGRKRFFAFVKCAKLDTKKPTLPSWTAV